MNNSQAALLAFHFGFNDYAQSLSRSLVDCSGGIGEYILGASKLSPFSQTRSVEEARGFLRRSSEQGYFRGFLGLSLSLLNGSYTEEELLKLGHVSSPAQSWDSPRWLEKEAFDRCVVEYASNRQADAAAFLAQYWSIGALHNLGVARDRNKALEVAEEAYQLGFTPIAYFLGQATIAHPDPDDSTSTNWFTKFRTAQSAFRTTHQIEEQPIQ